MDANSTAMYTTLSTEACRQRIGVAQSKGSNDLVGYSLSSEIDVVDEGDRFELIHKCEPAVLTGTVSSADNGSVISYQITAPAQTFYRLLLGFVSAITVLVTGTSVYDLLFGTHRLLTRSRTELGPGHPASLEQHFAVFLLVPLVAIPMITILWPKARGVRAETSEALRAFLSALLDAKKSGRD